LSKLSIKIERIVHSMGAGMFRTL